MDSRELAVRMKPLSVNDAWQGKRFKTDAYKAYETEMLLRLPPGEIPPPPYKVYYEFGFSNRQSDFDNPCKPLGDILQKKYGFNDSAIYEAHIVKRIVPKGNEYVFVRIEHIEVEGWKDPEPKRQKTTVHKRKFTFRKT